MAHRIWKETKQEPGTAGPGNMLGCCLVSLHFLWAILSTSTVNKYGHKFEIKSNSGQVPMLFGKWEAGIIRGHLLLPRSER